MLLYVLAFRSFQSSPGDKHKKGSHGFQPTTMGKANLGPTILDIIEGIATLE
jgi:hypothetical protein